MNTSTRPALVRRAAAALAVLAALSLGGCIVVARTADVYDPTCRTYIKQVVLEAEVIGAIGHCHNESCGVMLASMGIISAASAVVAGSVAIIGNIAYWAERKGQCPADAPPALPRKPA
jgi:hypothetical protein